MAPIGPRPFLEIIIESIQEQGIRHVVLAVGYRYKVIQEYFGERFQDVQISYAVESSPLGTGGAISYASSYVRGDHFFVLNGDTLFDVDLRSMNDQYAMKSPDMMIALKRVKNQDRYGLVELDEDLHITKFAEKQFIQEGLINGGIYLTNQVYLDSLRLPDQYSWEKKVLENQCAVSNYQGYISDSYFIDIGIPEDYARAQEEL